MYDLNKKSGLLDFLNNNENKDVRHLIGLFHQRLSKANTRRVNTDRSDLEKLTDTLGRLLVGDEVCAAVAIHDETIYIATNEAQYEKTTFSVKVKGICIKAGSTNSHFKLVFTIEHWIKDSEKFSYQTKEIHYYENKSTGIIELASSDREFKFFIPYERHQIDELPYDISFNFSLTEKLANSEFFKQRVLQPLNQDISIEITNADIIEFPLNPLRRRVKHLFEHMGLCALYSLLRDLQPTDKEIEGHLESNRLLVVRYTLGWEVPQETLRKGLREYGVGANASRSDRFAFQKRKEKLKELHEFIESMANHFFLFKKLRKLTSKKNLDNKYFINNENSFETLRGRWLEYILKSFRLKQIKNIPSYLADKPETIKQILEKVSHYCCDLLALEKFVENRGNSQLFQLLASIGLLRVHPNIPRHYLKDYWFFKKNVNVEIVDELPHGVHAELRLFHRFKKIPSFPEKALPYFGITLLCCANCHLFLKMHGIDYVGQNKIRGFAGTHARNYPGWIFPKEFRNEEYIKPFFGEQCYQAYLELSEAKRIMVFKIIENLGMLETNDLLLNDQPFKKVWKPGTISTINESKYGLKLIYLSRQLEYYSRFATRVHHGIYAGHLPRDLRMLNSILYKLKNQCFPLHQGLKEMSQITRFMGKHHPLHLAVMDALIGSNKFNFWSDAIHQTFS